MIGKHKVLQALRPNSAYALIDDAVVWYDKVQSEPTAEEISAKQAELQADYDAKKYQRDRKAEYPNHEDCIHALLDGGDTLTDLQTKRTAVKEKYPKE